MFENLSYWAENILENPIVLAFIIAILRVVLGFLGNKFRDRREKFDVGRFGETLVWYETMLILISQHPQLGVEGATVIGVILDVIRTASKLLKGE